MKRFTTIAATLALGLGVTIAVAPAASADPNPWVWAYPQANFQGSPQGLWISSKYLFTSNPTRSVKNVSQTDACGFTHILNNEQNPAVKFPFRAGGQWSTIGKPFVFNPAAGRTDDLTGFKWGKC